MYYCSFVSIQYVICECGDTFPTEEALKKHLEKDHVDRNETRQEIRCGKCDKVFTTAIGCLSHQRVHLQAGSKPGVSKASGRGKRSNTVVCEVCGKGYSSNAALVYHQRTHTGEKPYQCSMCSKAFTMPVFLKIHMRTHTGEKPHQCNSCPKAFTNKAALLRHNRVHTGDRPYVCEVCGKTFTQSNSMKLHVKTVHLKMTAPYKKKIRRDRPRGLQQKMEIEHDGCSQDDGKQIKTELISGFTEDYQEDVVNVYKENGRLYSQDGEVFEVYEENAYQEIEENPYHEETAEDPAVTLYKIENPEVLYEEVYAEE